MRKFWYFIAVLSLVLMAGVQPEELDAKPGVQSEALHKILAVMDEREQMEVMARYLREKGGIETAIVDQKTLPEQWSGYRAVVGYIHGRLDEKTELKIIDYTRNGGRFVCLHHMISSGKARNKYYFDFLGVHMDGIELARQPAEPGGHYAWREGIEQTIVNLNPGHFITSNGIRWPDKTTFSAPDFPAGKEYPSLTIDDSEVYMNVKFTDGKEKTVLLGCKYLDDRNQVLFQQAASGWVKHSGKGWIVYLQMGHTAQEFMNPVYAHMILNAITWKPKP